VGVGASPGHQGRGHLHARAGEHPCNPRTTSGCLIHLPDSCSHLSTCTRDPSRGRFYRSGPPPAPCSWKWGGLAVTSPVAVVLAVVLLWSAAAACASDTSYCAGHRRLDVRSDQRREQPSRQKVSVLLVQHWSMRVPWERKTSLWGSFAVRGPRHSFWFAGDTGCAGCCNGCICDDAAIPRLPTHVGSSLCYRSSSTGLTPRRACSPKAGPAHVKQRPHHGSPTTKPDSPAACRIAGIARCSRRSASGWGPSTWRRSPSARTSRGGSCARSTATRRRPSKSTRCVMTVDIDASTELCTRAPVLSSVCVI